VVYAYLQKALARFLVAGMLYLEPSSPPITSDELPVCWRI
jgi:hypothetical protein